jgi:hypothetical protein
MNAHHPSWSRADREPGEDWRNVLPIGNVGTSAFEPGTVTRIGSTGQRSSIIDLVISGPGHGIDGLDATIADDLRTGSDHEVLSWELFSSDRGLSDNIYDSETPAWKLRPPIKSDDQDELEEWRVQWQSGYAPFEDRMIEIKRFTRFSDDEFGRKRWSPHAKRWWNDKLEERKDLLSLPRKSQEYKTARAQWFKSIRRAKRECWEAFLQHSNSDLVWKAINAKPARQALPTLRVTKSDDSVELATTHTDKVAAIAAISFPDKDGDPIPPTPKVTPGAPPFQSLCVKGVRERLSTTSNTSAPGPDGIGYQALRLWNTIDPIGLCHLINLLITQGLPRDLKNAQVVVIGKPGKKDRSNPKSYRCIALLSSISKLTEKAVAQYLFWKVSFVGGGIQLNLDQGQAEIQRMR